MHTFREQAGIIGGTYRSKAFALLYVPAREMLESYWSINSCLFGLHRDLYSISAALAALEARLCRRPTIHSTYKFICPF